MDYKLHAVLHPHGHEHDDQPEDNLLMGPAKGRPGELMGQELASIPGSQDPSVIERQVQSKRNV